MTQGATLKERLDEAGAVADEALCALKDACLDRAQFEAQVRRFTLAKFFLDEGECASDNIFELAEASIEKLLALNDKSIKLAQGSNTCTNQSSTDIKKVLLSLTLQRELGVKFTPQQSAELETVAQLADALFDARGDAAAQAKPESGTARREGGIHA